MRVPAAGSNCCQARTAFPSSFMPMSGVWAASSLPSCSACAPRPSASVCFRPHALVVDLRRLATDRSLAFLAPSRVHHNLAHYQIRGHREREELKMVYLNELAFTFVGIPSIEQEVEGLFIGLPVAGAPA